MTSHNCTGENMAAKKVILCRLTFGEGRNDKVIGSITDTIRRSHGILLVSVESTSNGNITQYEFAGEPDDVVNAALSAAKLAHRLIDMSKGESVSPGALGLCIFSPIQSTCLEDCVYVAHQFVHDLSTSLDVSVCLRKSTERWKSTISLKHLVTECMCEGSGQAKLESQSSPLQPYRVASWGCTVVTVLNLDFLFQVYLIATNEQATRIANEIANSSAPFSSQCVKSMASSSSEYELPCVSFCLSERVNDNQLYIAHETVCTRAGELKLPVIGSRVSGVVPLKLILSAAEYFIEKENLFVLEEEHKVRLVVDRLGLSNLSKFEVKNTIIEYALAALSPRIDRLIDAPLNEFIKLVGERTPLPAGGSVSAVVASLGCALASMVGKMSFGRKMFEKTDPQMRSLIPIFHGAMRDVSKFIDADTDAYTEYIRALKMPKSNAEEEAARDAALEAGMKLAIDVPLAMARYLDKLWEPIIELAHIIIMSNVSDLEVGVNCIVLAITSSLGNITTNLHSVKDTTFKNATATEIDKIASNSKQKSAHILKKLEERKVTHSH